MDNLSEYLEIEKQNIIGRYKQCDLLHYGIDYFKAKIEFINCDYKTSRLKKLGLSDNSNFILLNKEIALYLESSEFTSKFDYYYKFIDIKTNTNLGFIMGNSYKNKKLGAVELNDIVEITGQGLALGYDLKYWIDILKKLSIKIDNFKRVDICFDISKASPDYLYNKVMKKKLELKTKTPFYKKGFVTGFYIGEVEKVKNTYQLIRIYDKKLDNKEKGKQWLYPYYSPYKYITRLEVEIRRDKACFLTIDNLLDRNYIFSILVKTFYGYNHKFFNQFSIENFKKCEKLELSRYKKRKEMQVNRLENFIKYGNDWIDDKDKKKTIQTFIRYAKKLIKNGYDLEKISSLLVVNVPELEKSD